MNGFIGVTSEQLMAATQALMRHIWDKRDSGDKEELQKLMSERYGHHWLWRLWLPAIDASPKEEDCREWLDKYGQASRYMWNEMEDLARMKCLAENSRDGLVFIGEQYAKLYGMGSRMLKDKEKA